MLGIIPAAGYGTRLYELGKSYPKSILPYKERPLLVWNVEWLREQGCDEIIIVVNHQKEKILDVVETYGLGASVTEPESMGGLSASVLSAINHSTHTHDRPVLIVLGDILVESGEVDFSTNSVSTFTVEDWSRWCMVDPKDGEFYDKPEDKPPTDQAISGVYHVKSCVEFSKLLRAQVDGEESIQGEFQISTSLSRLSDPVQCFHLDILDFGTLKDFLRNRGIRNSRSFNTVTVGEEVVVKSSSKKNKIIAEANWYRSLPQNVSVHTPRVLANVFHGESARASYTMERVLQPTLRELFLFLDRSEETWVRVFNECFRLNQKMKDLSSKESSFGFVTGKTAQRVKDLGETSPVVELFLKEFEEKASAFEKTSCLIHGDFCFSNLMWNSQTDRVIMLDPRGELYGSPYYDIAKLRHSALYGYDFVDAELYTKSDRGVKIFEDGTERLKSLYRSYEVKFFSKEEVVYLEYLTASLFLTMIPLHSHNPLNQQLFFQKFLEIYGKVSSKGGLLLGNSD